jgi:hypothetical protein
VIKKILTFLILLNLNTTHAANTVAFTYEAAIDNLTELFLKYQVSNDGIILGNVIVNDAIFSMNLDAQESKLSIFWPSEVFRGGQLELVKGDGSVLLTLPLNETNFETYTVNSGNAIKNSYHNLKTEIVFRPEWRDIIKRSGTFWTCLKTFSSEGGGTQLCTSPYKLTKSGLKMAPTNAGNKVFFNDSTPRKLKSQISLQNFVSKKIRWFAQIDSGLSWMVNEKVPHWKPLEIIGIDANTYRISGLSHRPLKYLTDHFTYKEHGFFYEYKPSPFINENDDYWSIHVQATNELDLDFMNPAGGIYTARINIANAPNILSNPLVLNIARPQLTYSSQKQYKVSLEQNSKFSKSSNLKATRQPNQYHWSTNNLKKGAITKSTINLVSEDNTEKSYYLEMYRGYPLDFGIQYTASTISGTNTQGSEMHLAYWAEDFFGLAEADWLRLRFGFQYKYFKPFKKLLISRDASGLAKKEVDFLSSTFDIKYRFVPGLWGRDESFGLMLAHHDFNFDAYKMNLFGTGFFWARSMPNFFDDLFNYLPFFRFPKWVNAEYIQFVSAANSDLKVSNISHLNFYGKVMWTNNLYGDLGFGMRTYNFSDPINSNSPSLRLFFLTMGIGFIF